jgi:hypothetical protein
VQVHHDEGVANRIDPKSCAAACEGSSEALTGERTGQPLSRESTLSPGAARVPRRPGVVADPGMCGRSLHGNREAPRPGHLPTWSASGRRGAARGTKPRNAGGSTMTGIAASGERGDIRHVVARLERLPYCSWHLKMRYLASLVSL